MRKQPNSRLFEASRFTEETVDGSVWDTQAVRKELYEPRSYVSYLQERKSHRLLSALTAAGSPVPHGDERSGKELFDPETIYLALARTQRHSVHDMISRRA